MKTVSIGQTGPAVEDVQRRLGKLGYDLGRAGIDAVYSVRTAAAVREFRKAEGLPDGESVDEPCWSALVDATFSLGDRTLFLRYPFFHGCDIEELQEALNVLGFTVGYVDGIFGAHTESALREFQANVGIDPDGIAGSLTFNAINRLHPVWAGKDATPHSAAQTGFSRAAEVLTRIELCVFGDGPITRDIASRISNLAMATTPESHVTSADSIGGIPPQTMMLIHIALCDSAPQAGIPFVTFSDDGLLGQRLMAAARTAQNVPPRIVVDVPISFFADVATPTPREKQHVAVVLLDSFCSAFE